MRTREKRGSPSSRTTSSSSSSSTAPKPAAWSATSTSEGRSSPSRHSGRVRRHRHREERLPPRVRPRLSRRRGRRRRGRGRRRRGGHADERESRRARGAADPGRAEARPGDPRPGHAKSRSPRRDPRVTAQVSLAGRFLVYMPFASACRREPQDRRARRAAAAARAGRRRCCPTDSGGVIVRTVGEDVTPETFERELQHADRPVEADQEEDALRPVARRSSIARRSLTRGIIRDIFSTKVEQLTVDSKQVYNEIIEYLKGIAPELVERIKLYEEHDAAVRQGGDRDRDPRPVQASLRSAVGRLPDHRADRGARLRST